ncbi:MAG TPA: glycosyltransferase family 4 protein [Pirellulales bacterium]|nr:glycosyltransferase family 4 protein [Pirellulales bacterium]
MRVLALSNLYPPDVIGGYELCCRQVVDGLLQRGHDVRVLTSAPRAPCPGEPHVARSFKLTNCYDASFILRSNATVRAMWEAESNLVNAFNVHALTSALAHFEPQVVYLWNLVGLGGLGLVGCLRHIGMPWVWYLGDCVPRMLCSPGKELLPVIAAEFSRQVSGHYMPVSQRVVEEIEDAGVRLNGDVEIMPNWVLGPRPEERQRFYRPGDTLRIVSAGQIARHKGIDLLIGAARLLRDRGYENFTIDLYGKAWDPKVIPLARQEGVGDRVTFKGSCPQDELLARYARHEYDLFAFPTWEREPFGCAPLEAGAYGCVMAMSQSCGIGEWFVDGVHCLKVERSARGLADVFQAVLDGQIDLGPLARRAGAVIWRDFHLDALLPRIEEVLSKASRSPTGGGGTFDEAYHLALLAERLAQVSLQERALASWSSAA